MKNYKKKLASDFKCLSENVQIVTKFIITMNNRCIFIIDIFSFQEEMTNALATMRVDYEQCQIKNLEESDNPILKKRKRRQENEPMEFIKS